MGNISDRLTRVMLLDPLDEFTLKYLFSGLMKI
jgi:hypothetical protein